MKIIKNLSLIILTTLFIGCGSGSSSIVSNSEEVDGFWQDLEYNQMIEIKNNSLYRYSYYKDMVHDTGGECYSRYNIANIESNATEPTILNYLYYQDRFSYSGPIKIVMEENELKFLRKYGDEYNQANEVVNHYEKLPLSNADINICDFADRTGGITDKNQLAGLWKLPNDFKFEPSNEHVIYWLISSEAQVSSLIYNQNNQCYSTLNTNNSFSNYYFINNVNNDGRFNLVYNAGTSPGNANYEVLLASINDNILTFFGFYDNDVSSLTKEDEGSIRLCN